MCPGDGHRSRREGHGTVLSHRVLGRATRSCQSARHFKDISSTKRRLQHVVADRIVATTVPTVRSDSSFLHTDTK